MESDTLVRTRPAPACCGSACEATATPDARSAAGPGHAHGHDGHDHGHGHDGAHGHGHHHGAEPSWTRLAAALLLALTAEAAGWLGGDALPWRAAGMALAALAIGLAGLDVYREGWRALVRGRLDIQALMAVAVTGAFAIGHWPEAAMVMALYGVAERIEGRAAARARQAIEGLLALAPETALVLGADGRWQRTPSAEVAVGATVRVAPGERIPLDGVVTRGESTVDQAPITGESLPVDKAPGAPVFAGTINQAGEVELQVSQLAANTTLARIVHAVEDAQATRAPVQRLVDRFAAIYTPLVFAIALATALLLPLLLGAAWLDALYQALVLLVIACPCALVISTPVTVVSALSAAARRGILVKGGAFLEHARRIRAVALDKTGTVTEGRPRLVEWQALAGIAEADVQRWALALASRSDHPVSQAIAAGLPGPAAGAQAVTALPGRGVQAQVDGRTFLLANHRTVQERGLDDSALATLLARHQAQGRSVAVLADEARALALFAVADTIKPSSREAVAELARLGITTVMLTGDSAAAANTIAGQAGIADVRGGLLPQDKLTAIAALQEQHGVVAMVGDGINDAPALARADLGFAMGAAGSDTAMEAADVVVMNDDLRRVAQTVRLSRRTHAVLVQNLALAVGIKAVFLALAIAGAATMWMAVFADLGATLLVVANGLRLARVKR